MLISAPRPATDRHALIAQARQSLLTDGAAPVRAEVEPWIARSWQRCLARGLEPTRRVAFDAVSATALRHSQEQNHHLLRAAANGTQLRQVAPQGGGGPNYPSM